MKKTLPRSSGQSSFVSLWITLAMLLFQFTGFPGLAKPVSNPPIEPGVHKPLPGSVPLHGPDVVSSLLPLAPAVTTLTQTSCGQTFNVLSSFTGPDAIARTVSASSVSVRNQPANGRVRVNADGTFNFTPTVTTAGTSTFTLTALPTSTSFVTTSGLTVSQNITCDPLPGIVPALCSITNQANITSPSLTDFATVTQTTLFGETTIKATLNGTAAAGDRAGFIISSDAFLSASLLQSYTINTYLGTSNTVRNTRTFSSLLGIELLSGNLAEISLPTTQTYDRVELVISSLVGVVATTNVYYGFSRPAPIDQVVTVSFPANVCTDLLTQTSCGQAFDILSNDIPTGTGILNPASVTIPTQPANGTVFVNTDGTIRFTPNVQTAGTANFSYSVCTTTGPTPTTLVTTGGTSASGITGICVLCSVSNSENVGDANLTNAAVISIPVSVTGSGYIRAKLNGVSRAGNLAGFVVGNNNVLTLQLLTGFTITTYRNGEQVEQRNGGTLLNLQILSGGQYEISFQTSRDFDEVEIRAGALVGVLNQTQVYYGFSRFAQTCNSYNAQINFAANVCPPFTFNCANASVSGTFIANNTSGQSGTVVIPFSTPITAAQTGGVTFNVSGTGFTSVGNPFTTTLTAGQTSVSIPIAYNGTGAAGVRTLTISSALAATPCSVTATVNPIPTTPNLLVVTPANNTTVTTTPTFSGTATPGSIITVLGINGLLTPGVGITADLSGNFSTGLLLPLANGPQTLTVVAVNPFNPGLIATQPVTVTVVSTPALTVLTPVNNTTVTATPTFSGTATPGSLITVLGINGLLTPGVGITADLSGNFSTGLLLPLANGPQTLTVVAVNPFNPGLIATQPVTVTVVSTPALTVLTPVNNTTVTTTPTFSGTATPGSLITVLGINGLLTPGVGITADLSGNFSTGLLLPLANGPQTLTVVAVNPFNPGLIATQPVTVTVVSTPALTVLTPVNNTTVTATPTFSGTATPGSLITILGINGLLTPGVGITADLSGNFSTGLLLPLANGPQTLTVVAVNPFNPGLIATQPVTVTVVSQPNLLVVTPANNSTVTATPTFSGTATPGSIITVLGINGLLTPGVGITADLSGNFSTGLLLPLANGPQTLTVVAVNPFNPGLIATQPVTVTVVSTPALTVLTPVNNTTVTTTPTFSGTATPGSIITVLGINGLLTPGVGITADLSGNFSTGLLLPLANGPQTLTVVAVNPFNPGLIATQPVTVTVVSTPALTVLTPVNNTTVTTTPTFSGTATPGSIITVLGINGLLTPGVGITADLSGNFSTGLLLPLANGPQTLTVVAVNPFNPGLIATQPVTVTVVSTPALTVLTPVNNTTVTTTPTFSGTATPGSLITVLGINGLLTPGVGITADLSGNFSTGLLLPLANGPQTLTVVAVNPFNPGLIATQPVTVTVVSTPALTVLTPVNNTTVTATPTFSGTATPGSLITILGINGLLTPGVGITADLSGNFSTGLLLPLANGPQTLTVVAVNPFNPGLIATQPVTVTVVSTPALTVLTPVNNTTVTTTPTFSGTATPGSIITVLGINGLLTPGVGITADLSGNFSTGLLLPLANGPQTLTVVAVNPFNPGLIATQPVTVTVVSQPNLLVVTPANNSTVTATPTFSGTATPGSIITVLGINGLLTPGVGITADLSGNFSTGLLLPLANGPQTLTVVAVNPFNPGLIATQPVTVTVVSTPALTVLTPVNNTTVTTTPTFSGTATPGSIITVLGLNGLLTPGVGITADLSGNFSTGLLLPLSVGGPQTFTVVAVSPFNPGLIATQAVTVTVVSGQPSPLFTLDCAGATVTGVFTANGVGGQTGTLNLPILNALAGPVSLTIGGTNFSSVSVPFATTLTAGQTAISIPIIFNGNGLAGFQTISITTDQGAGACSVTVPIMGPVGSLTFTQTTCAQSFSVLSSFSAVGSGAIDPATVQVVNQPANGTVRVNADGTINFQPTASSAGTATFTIAAASTLTNPATQQFVTTSDLTVSNNLLCQPIVNLCPIVDENNIISASLTDFAHLEQTALLGTTTIKATLNGTGQAGDLAGFIIANPTLLSAAVLPTYTINTYLGSSTTVRDSKTFSSLLDIQLLSGGRQELSFQTSQSFDRVELVIATAAAVLLSNDIYYGFSKPATVYMQKVVTINYGADICTDVFSQTACAQSFTVLANDIASGSGILDPTTVSIPTQPTNGTVTVGADGTLMFTPSTPGSGTAVFSYSVCTKADPAATANNTTNGVTSSGLNGICVLCSVTNETAVGDANLTNFATISIPVGVAGSGFVQAKLNQMAPAGDVAGFVIGNANILSVGFLNSITLSTYKGGVLQEQKTGSSLLTLQLLSGSQYTVKFQTTKEFDEVRFSAGALVDVLSNTQVYYGFASFGQVCQSQNVRIEFPANVCAGPPTIAILSPVNNATVTTTPTISGTATPGSTVVISTVGNATACQTTASASGTYACGIMLPVGVQSVTAVATNQNGTSAPATVTVVVVAPANPGYVLNVKVLLQGALLSVPSNTTLMSDNIRAGGYLPTTTPYSATLSPRFAQTGGGGGETSTPAVFSANAGTPNAIVDWVLVELRDAANPATIVATRSGLVQRDGDIVLPADGTSPLTFTGLSGSSYYVAVKHRNHLGVMTAMSVPMSTTGTIIDFTTLSNAQVYDRPGALAYDGLEMVTVNGKRALWAGDANADGKLKYIGLASDNTQILNDVITAQGMTTNPTYNYDFAFGYFAGDLDMNAKVKYQGTTNDPSVIFNNVIANYPLNTQNLYNYDFFVEQLP